MWLVKPANIITDHGLLSGLSDDDHLQYLLRNVLTTHGDIFSRNASVIQRIAPNTDGKILTTHNIGSLPTWEPPLAEFARIGKYENDAYGGALGAIIDESNGILYHGCAYNILKINLFNFSLIANVATGYPYGLQLDSTYLYYIHFLGTEGLYRLLLSDFSTINFLDLSAYITGWGSAYHTKCCAIDTKNNLIYIGGTGGATSNGTVVKVNTSTFAYVADIDLGNYTTVNGMCIDAANQKLYLACLNRYVKKIRLDTFAVEATYDAGTPNSDFSNVFLNNDKTLLFAIRQNGEVHCLKTSNMNILFDKITGLGTIHAGDIDASAGYLYLATWANPSKIIVIRTNDCTVRTSFDLSNGEGYGIALTVDKTRGHHYVGCYIDPLRIVKIRSFD